MSRLAIVIFVAIATVSTAVAAVFSPGNAVFSTGKIDLHIPLTQKRPILAEVSVQLEGNVRVEADGFVWNEGIEMENEIKLVDEYLESTAEGKERARRKIVSQESKLNGEISDSALNGIDAVYSTESTKDDWKIELEDDRGLTGALFDALFAQAITLGLWVEFPEEAELGSTVEIDLRNLTPLLMGCSVAERSPAKLTLDSYDAVNGIATLSGDATFAGTDEVLEVPSRFESSGKITVETSPRESRIVRISYAGTLVFSGVDGATVKGGGKHTATLETEIDPKKVESAAKKKPKFRKRKVLLRRMKVGFFLPSHWTAINRDPGERFFVRTLDQSKGDATLTVKFLGGDSSYQPGLYFDQLYTGLKADYPDIEYSKTSNPLGREDGRVYMIPPGRKNENFLVIEVYPHDGQYLMFRLSGPTKACAAAHKEFKAAKSSMGVLLSGK